jgi:hypothetical protein
MLRIERGAEEEGEGIGSEWQEDLALTVVRDVVQARLK